MVLAQRAVKTGLELDENTWQEVHKGMRQSVYQEKRELAIKLLRQGAALDFISKVTYITLPEIQKLNRELTSVPA